MNKNKGFTLVELIGIVIILGLTVIIGVPSLLKTLQSNENTEFETFKETLYLATETYIADNIDSIIDFSNSGDITYIPLKWLNEKSLISSNLINPDTGSSVTMKELIKVTIEDDNSYNYEITNRYSNGTPIYLNPVTGEVCSDYASKYSSPGYKKDCMKWYVFDDNDNPNLVKLILDHNTINKVAWNSNGSNSQMNEVQNQLDSLESESGWVYTPRLITAYEIASISGNTDFDATSNYNAAWFYLGSNNQSDYSKNSNFAWLFDYTYDCTAFGCNVDSASTYGYWTSTASSNGAAWVIDYGGVLFGGPVTYSEKYGVRPVIEIPRKKI